MLSRKAIHEVTVGGKTMKVILKENIETLGHIGDIVKVAPGYARNFLIPKGFAIEATSKNMGFTRFVVNCVPLRRVARSQNRTFFLICCTRQTEAGVRLWLNVLRRTLRLLLGIFASFLGQLQPFVLF